MSNIRPYVIINGVDSRTIQGLLITSLPPISKPAQRTLTETIDGRDGDSSVKLGYSAYDKSLGIALTFGYNVDDVISFFNSEGTIVFSNEPDKLYNFEIFEAIDFEKLIRFKTATVTIHTQPFKFSTTENPLEFTSKEFNVVNNGNTDSRPNLVITGEGLATMQINGKNALNIDFGDAEQTLLIDSEGMNAYHTNNIKSIKAEIVATGGNGTPDNPIPINGYTEANITRCGVNLLPTLEPQTLLTSGLTAVVGADGVITLSGTSTANGSLVLAEDANGLFTMPSGMYLHYFNDFANARVALTFEYKGGGNFGPSFNTLNKIYAVPSSDWGKVVTKIRIYFLSGTTLNNAKFSPMFALSSTAIPYTTYTGNTYTIAFGDTYYGGVLDVTRGKLHVTWGAKKISDISWNYDTNSLSYPFFWSEKITNKALNKNALCSCFVNSGKNRTQLLDNQFGFYNDGSDVDRFAIRCDSITSISDLLTNLGNECFAYELATPFNIDLTPVQISALLGVNNVYSNIGNVTVIFVNDGQDETQTGAIVSFDLDESDLNKGDLANRLVSGNYANIRLKTGSNAIKFIGSVSAVGLDKYSRWL